MYYTKEQIIEVAKSAEGYKGIPKGYWWCAIRSNPTDRAKDQFCCTFYLMYSLTIDQITTCTTVPGLPALKGGFKKYNNKGAGIVCANVWMYDTFRFGLHSGRMRALRMVKPVWSTRDGNLNDTAEQYGQRTWGNIYANVHGSVFDWRSNLVRLFVGEWSYACIVLNNNSEYREIIDKLETRGNVSGIIIDEFSV